jgi:RNA polymerase sigma factor (sigma-70 family)
MTASSILHLIRRVVEDHHVKHLTDQELLCRFSSVQDEAAFHGLLRRHGSMVLDVCRNVLGNDADAEDAFQATFLILVHKAAAIRKQASVGSWLYGVAYRTALKARAHSAKRQMHETRAHGPSPSGASDELGWREIWQVLHEELNRLSESYRAPLVLCYLEGKTQKEAATLLGVSKATVNNRLEHGLALLRCRLVERGLGWLPVLVVAALPAATASAKVSAVLSSATVQAAKKVAAGQSTAGGVISAKVATLTQEVLKAMLLTKLKTNTAALLVAGLLAWGVLQANVLTADPATVSHAALVQQPAAPNQDQAPDHGPPGPKAADPPTVRATPVSVLLPELPAAAPQEKGITYVDLQPKANQKLKEKFHNRDGNDLAELKPEKQTLEGLKFNVGEGAIQLANSAFKDKLPEKVEGIKVDAKFAKLHILHATGYSTDDDTVIAKYIVHYADKSTETIEVIFGKHVRDWWLYPGDKEPTEGKVVWTGANDAAKGFNASLRLFAMTWKNPHTNKQVVAIDYVSTLTQCAPFMVAMTLEAE